MKRDKPLVVLLSTGLGRIRRGYENHITVLGDALLAEPELPFKVNILSGKRIAGKPYRKIWNITRNNPILFQLRLSWKKRFQAEQVSFLLGMLPYLFRKKPALIYLAEYDLYCWLFKFRKLMRLKFGLVLYTGGHAIPGLFETDRDYIHHVNNHLIQESLLACIPLSRQSIIPHIIGTAFSYRDNLISDLRKKAGSKLIFLSVGAHNTNHKRIDLLAQRLKPYASQIFPIVVGDQTEETKDLQVLFQQTFGDDYMLTSCNQEEIGSYYACANAFISASAFETFGLAYAEAGWHGLECLCHLHKTAKELFGDNLQLVDFGDEAAFDEAIIELIARLKQPWCANKKIHDFIEQRYSWRVWGPNYKALFCYALN